MEGERSVVLVVDDQETIRHAVVTMLKDQYHVRPFASGESFLRYLETRTADLILLDYIMPGMSGPDVLARLQSNDGTKAIPVVFLTGMEDAGIEAKLLEKGAADYIHKPFNATALQARVRTQMELSRYRRRLHDMVEEQTGRGKRREEIALSLLARACDLRDRGASGHVFRMTEMVRLMVSFLQKFPIEEYLIAEEEGEDLVRAAKLHDLGKLVTPDRILLKPDRLQASEYEVVKLHPAHGAGLLDEYFAWSGEDPFLRMAREIARFHHEKWDGTGYPEGRKEREIPLSARIAAVADVYDALTSERPYRPPHSHQAAVEILTEESGTHFDPYLISVFLKCEEGFRDIASSEAWRNAPFGAGAL